MTWEPLTVGLVATVLAVAQILGWLALGSCFLKNQCDDIISIPTSLLIGSALTAFFYAIFAASGNVRTGIAFGIVTVVVAVVFFRQRLLQISRSLLMVYAELGAGRRWILALWTATLVLYWAIAITPPRNADVMVYHLAHIRQIDMENAWLPIPDWFYALPFGWSLNYLPFEHFGIPQVANLLSLGLWIIVSGLLIAILRQQSNTPLAFLLCALLIYHPHVLKFATTAHADMYTIFDMLSITLLVIRLPTHNLTTYGLLGFAAWIGMQSRYQAIAIGLSVTLFMLVWAARGLLSRKAVLSYAAGVGCAWLLSSPFYVFNFLAFKNPVWPLMVPQINGLTNYADRVAATITSSVTGSFTFDTIIMGLYRLIIEPSVFPIPILAIGLILVSLYWRPFPITAIALLEATYLLLWGCVQPSFEPRYSMYLGPLISVGWATILDLDQWTTPPIRRHIIQTSLTCLIIVFIGFAIFYSYDFLEYLVTGDLLRFHHSTAYYEVYDWVNRTTPTDAKFLVIVHDGQSYYLKRPHRLADPYTSWLIDWTSLKGAEHLDKVMEAEGYSYVIYEYTDWSDAAGGTQLSLIIEEADNKKLLTKLAVFHSHINISRAWRQTYITTVSVLVRNKTGNLQRPTDN